jgi:2-oxoglutarate dehydrogenase E1 component
LQLCAQENMQVCVPTTPAQIFHLLRRQVLQKVRKPLIVMTPKSLLRHKLAVSSLEDLSHGSFQRVISAEEKELKEAKRLIFCSGRIYYDLLESKEKNNLKNMALIRLEQLYPFPEKEVDAILTKAKKAKEIFWCQEEPQNQGAWQFVRDYLPNAHFVGRKPAASPAEGSLKAHVKVQQAIVMNALM